MKTLSQYTHPYLTLIPLLIILTSCSSQPKSPQKNTPPPLKTLGVHFSEPSLQEKDIRVKLSFSPPLARMTSGFKSKEIREPNFIISLPKNFSPEKSYPLFVWVTGGGLGDIPKRMFHHQDFICVNLPIFKSDADFNTLSPEPADGKILVEEYGRIITALSEKYNIDTENSIWGSRHQGCNSSSLLLYYAPEWFTKTFNNIFFIDSKEVMISYYQHIEDPLRILFLTSDQENFLESTTILNKRLNRVKNIDSFIIKVPPMGHSFPKTALQKIADWLLETQP